MKAVLYAAKSTADLKGSIPDQLAACRALAAAEGWEIAGEFSDEAASAYTGNRGVGLERAMALAEQLAPAALVVWHSNRIARGGGDSPDAAKHLAEYLFRAQRASVRLCSVQDDHTFSNPILAVVMGEMAHQESKIKSANVRKGIERRRATAKSVGPVPLGYEPDPEFGLRPLKAEVRHVKRVFELAAAGLSYQAVAREMNLKRVPTKRGGTWAGAVTAQMIRNRQYLGEIRDGAGGWMVAKHEAIIDRVLFDTANAPRQRRGGQKGNGGGRKPSVHLLTGGLLIHGRCGSAMWARSTSPPRRDGGRDHYYECPGVRDGRCDVGLKVPQAAVDEVVISHLAATSIDAERSRQLIADRTAERRRTAAEQLAAAEKERAEADEALERVRRDYMRGAITAEDWLDLRPRLEEELEAASAALEPLSAAEAAPDPQDTIPAAMTALEVVQASLAGGNLPAVRGAIEQLFESFTIGETDEGLTILPEPRLGALETLDGAVLVDEHGETSFRRVPLPVEPTAGLSSNWQFLLAEALGAPISLLRDDDAR